jgi:folate-binding Fe-S cluster repair protein YgfZ
LKHLTNSKDKNKMFCRRMSSISLRLGLNKIQNCGQFRGTHFYAIKLTNKKLIRVSGVDSFIYIQSLITNDLRHLLDGEEVPQRSCVYAFMLSALGKVLCDLFIYKTKLLSEGELILEVIRDSFYFIIN